MVHRFPYIFRHIPWFVRTYSGSEALVEVDPFGPEAWDRGIEQVRSKV